MFVGQPEAGGLAERLARDRFSAVEIAMPITPDPFTDEFRRAAVACGRQMTIPVVFHEALPLALANEDRGMADRIRRRVRETLDLAAEAGVRIVTLHTTSTRTVNPMSPGWKIPGTRWLAHEMDRRVTQDLDVARRVFIELLREIGPAAAAAGVTVAVENNFRDTRYFGDRIESVRDVLDLVMAADAPGVKLCFDAYKAFSTEPSLPDAIRACGPWIANVHVSDFEAADTTIGVQRRPLGRGRIDWAAVLLALRDTAYDGPMILEMMASEHDLIESRDHLERVAASLGTGTPVFECGA
jgi:sugar phosphate isomerase/epimerase